MSDELLRDLARAKAAFQLRAIEMVIRGPALAAATRRAKTPKAVECEASQSGAAKTAQRPTSVASSDKERE